MSNLVTKTTKHVFVYSISPFLVSVLFVLSTTSDKQIEPANVEQSQYNVQTLSEQILKTDIDQYKTDMNFEPQESRLGDLNNLLNHEIGTLSKGTLGLYYKNLRTEEVLEINAIEHFPPASTFKVYTAILTLQAYERGELNLNNYVKLSPGLFVDYGTVLKEKDIGKNFSINTLLNNMIVYSCNTSQSMLFAKLGRNEIDNNLKANMNLQNSSLDNFHTTPQEMGYTLEKLYEGELLNSQNRELLMSLLNKTVITDRIRAGLPEGTIVANKTGTLDGSKHDAAIVSSPNGDYILSIYTKDANANEAVNKIVNLSKIVWEANDGL